MWSLLISLLYCRCQARLARSAVSDTFVNVFCPNLQLLLMCSFSWRTSALHQDKTNITSIWYRNITFKLKQEWLKCKYLRPWPSWCCLVTSSRHRGVLILSGEAKCFFMKTLFHSDRTNWPKGPSVPQLLALSSQLSSCCQRLMIQFTMDHQPPLIQPMLPSGLE